MVYNISISPKAKADILRYSKFVANVSPKAAAKLVGNIETSISNLAKDAMLYPLFHNQFRKIVVEKNWAIFYAVVRTNVNVYRVHDMRQAQYNEIVLEND